MINSPFMESGDLGMSNDDVEYFRKRAEQERARARETERQHVAEIHEEIARLYEAMIERAEQRQSVEGPV